MLSYRGYAYLPWLCWLTVAYLPWQRVSFEWSCSAFNLSDPWLSRDGNARASFFLLPDILNPGSTYSFELRATARVRASGSSLGAPNSSWSFSTFGTVQVTVNRLEPLCHPLRNEYPATALSQA